jgi:dTDP-4-dehydrorhamnose 3,5-epimerase
MLNIIDTPFADLYLIQRHPKFDNRGYLERLFCFDSLEKVLGGKSVRQINHTLTRQTGTVRGMHYQQPPFAEVKMVSCIKGEICDIVVDIREDSATFLQSFSVNLSEKDFLSILIPEGFAHGFQSLTDNCELIYFHTADYQAEAEKGLNPSDPMLGISWPMSITDLSPRDENHAFLNNNFKGIKVV